MFEWILINGNRNFFHSTFSRVILIQCAIVDRYTAHIALIATDLLINIYFHDRREHIVQKLNRASINLIVFIVFGFPKKIKIYLNTFLYSETAFLRSIYVLVFIVNIILFGIYSVCYPKTLIESIRKHIKLFL